MGAPQAQGKKNLSHRGLRSKSNKKKNVFDKNSNEEDATIDIAATLADFDTAGEKVDDMIPVLRINPAGPVWANRKHAWNH